MARLHFANRYRICGTVGLLVENFSSNGKVCLNHLCQPRGQAQGMPSGLSPPPGLGIITRRTGCGPYVLLRNSSPIPVNHVSNPVNSISSKLCPSTPGAPLLDRASLYAWDKMSSRYT